MSDATVFTSPIFSALHQGRSNYFALSTLATVAIAPGEVFNPLWIYGSSGVGKTAMLDATAGALAEHPSRPLILRIHAEQFLHDWIRAIKHEATADFFARILGFQVVIVDHMDCLCGRDFTQEQFARLMARAADQGIQVILASAYSPRELQELDKIFRNLCQWYLCANVVLPSLEERFAITRRMARERELPLSEGLVYRISAAAHTPARIRCIIHHLAARRKLLALSDADLPDALEHLLEREVVA